MYHAGVLIMAYLEQLQVVPIMHAALSVKVKGVSQTPEYNTRDKVVTGPFGHNAAPGFCGGWTAVVSPHPQG